MIFLRRLGLLVLMLGILGPATVHGQDRYDTSDYEQTMNLMLDAVLALRETPAGDTSVFEAVAESGDPLYIAPLVDLGYFLRGQHPMTFAVADALESTTGEEFGLDWQAFFEYAGRENVELPPGYADFKRRLLVELIDPNFADFFPEGVEETAQVNMVEVIWGGVRVDGIPSLVNAQQITPETALEQGEALRQFCRSMPDGPDCAYPAPTELVFGVSINGDSRAYPLRLLNWHEMFNDVIGSTPLYTEPDADSDPVCDFRAPTIFRATAQQGGEWVQIHGVSAGCPESGWVSAAAVDWVRVDRQLDVLPDLAAGEDALEIDDGPQGRIDGTPVMLAYCTLCGSGVLYSPVIEDLSYTDFDGEEVDLGTVALEFGSTGLLMRSNKLMYDRDTNTVWNALSGTPAFGPLADTDIQLEILPVVISDWATWLEEHPDTSVLSLDTGFRRNYTNGGAYTEYFNDPNFIMFPVWQQDTSEQENKEMVFGLNVQGVRKAYPLRLLVPEGVVNDTIVEQDVVIVARETPDRNFFEPGGAAVRAYASEGMTFSPGDTPFEVLDADGNVWQVTEAALIGPDGAELPRLGGHLAFWFGWFSFFPDTEVYAS